MRTVILGPEVMCVAPGSSFRVSVQLQQEDGAVAESKRPCLGEGGGATFSER